MRVRAQRPSYWIGETFDTWDGQSWKVPPKSAPVALYSGSPFPVPPAVDSPLVNDSAAGQSDLQTFYMAQSSPNLIFHADDAAEVWFPARDIYHLGRRHHRLPHRPRSRRHLHRAVPVNTPTTAQLEAVSGSPASDGDARTGQSAAARSAAAPPLPRVQALAERITAQDRTTDAKVQALIAWIGAHTHYSTDIPPLPPGADTVDEFLFGNRTGFCEQISTAMAVMLRSIGIPAREAVGYVPGSYNPITDLYEVQGQGRPRLGPGVVPPLRLAELRPHRRGAPGQPLARGHPRP